jgi:hypothetical protein
MLAKVLPIREYLGKIWTVQPYLTHQASIDLAVADSTDTLGFAPQSPITPRQVAQLGSIHPVPAAPPLPARTSFY